MKGYGFLFFAKNMGKSLSNKYGQKLLDSAKKFNEPSKFRTRNWIEINDESRGIYTG